MDERLGRRGKDKVTGFEGCVTGVFYRLNAPTRLQLSAIIATGAVHERWVDEENLEMLES